MDLKCAEGGCVIGSFALSVIMSIIEVIGWVGYVLVWNHVLITEHVEMYKAV